MAGGYKVPRDGEVGLRAMFRDLQQQIDALRSAAPLTSTTVTKGGPVFREAASASTVAVDGSATRLFDGVAEVRADATAPWIPLETAILAQVPPPGPVTPVQPSSSPTPVTDGFAGLVLLRWVGITNSTPVDYEVHVSASNATAPDSTTRLDVTQGTAWSVRTLPNGTSLSYATDYYFGLWAKSGGVYAAAPSAWVVGQMDKTRNSDLAADAIDGMVITGTTVRTASAGAREQITTAEGYQSFDSAAAVQTQIKNGKLTTRDGEFTGTITGSSIVGGAIAIAQGVASTETQDFETVATGTVPPTGWTRTVVANAGSVAGNGVDFLTTGGNPGRRLRLTTAATPDGSFNQSTQVVGPSTLGADFIIGFDYIWTGTKAGFSFPPFLGLILRGTSAGDMTAGCLRLNFIDGETKFFDGITPSASAAVMTVNVWYRVTITLRGPTMQVRLVPATGPALPDTTFMIGTASRLGRVEFRADTSGLLGATTAAQSISIDDVTIQVLQTGLNVTPDGNVTAERLIVNQSAQVPSPLMPGDATNKAYVDAADATSKAYVDGRIRVGVHENVPGTGVATASKVVTFSPAFATGIVPSVIATAFNSPNFKVWITNDTGIGFTINAARYDAATFSTTPQFNWTATAS